jgi:Ser/Thr protein kinase RdoA (MazF antagonist)
VDPATIETSLDPWAGLAGGRATLINVSENHTWRIDTPSGPSILRLHRPFYQSPAAIESELAWVAALRDLLPVPRPIAGRDGRALQRVADRQAVLFDFEPGLEPAEDGDLAPLFEVLGRYAATAHRHVGSWQRPRDFFRPAWTAASILDADGLWGDWRAAPGVDPVRGTLAGLDLVLRDRLAAYGTSPDRFGLIHADMRLTNLLVDGDDVTLIDFDDCGFGWFVYDLAASLSFIELRADRLDLIGAWLRGYTAVRPLAAEDIAMIEPMILLRRMALLAWIGSHADTDLGRRHAPRFAADTAMLAGRLLR